MSVAGFFVTNNDQIGWMGRLSDLGRPLLVSQHEGNSVGIASTDIPLLFFLLLFFPRKLEVSLSRLWAVAVGTAGLFKT